MLQDRLSLRRRIAQLNIGISVPCRHGWVGKHCTRDDEGSHPGPLLPTDECFCGESEYREYHPLSWLDR